MFKFSDLTKKLQKYQFNPIVNYKHLSNLGWKSINIKTVNNRRKWMKQKLKISMNDTHLVSMIKGKRKRDIQFNSIKNDWRASTDIKRTIGKKKKGFPGGSAKTLSCRCREPRFSPWSENWIPCAAAGSSHASSEIPPAAAETNQRKSNREIRSHPSDLTLWVWMGQVL